MVQEKGRYSSNSGIYQNNFKYDTSICIYLEFCGMRKYIGCAWTQYFKDIFKNDK